MHKVYYVRQKDPMKKTSFSRPQRFLAAFVAGIYFSTQCVLANAPESNLWTERREKARQLKGENLTIAALPAHLQSNNLPQILNSLPPVSTTAAQALPASVRASLSKDRLADISSLLAALPYSYGTVRQINMPAARTDKTVIHIQDVHQNQDAQTNIGKALQELIDQNKVNLVALEGTADPIDVSGFRAFPHRETVAKVADRMLRDNRISGPVHAALTSAKPIPPLIGIDHAQHYQANIEAYRAAAPVLENQKQILSKLQGRLNQKKKNVFNPDLLAFDDKMEAYRAGRRSLSDHIQFLAAQKPVQGQVDIFLEALKMEASLNFQRVEAERAQLIEELVKKVGQEQITALIQQSVAYRLGQTRHTDFYGFLNNLCRKNGVALARFPAMDAYVRYILLSDNLEAEKLLAEVEFLEHSSTASLAKTPEEKSLLSQSKHLYLVSKLLDFSLSSEEWGEYKSQSSLSLGRGEGEGVSVDLSPLTLQPFESFYKEAEARDQAMVDNLLKAMAQEKAKVAVIVTGGFHSRGMDNHFKRAGLATITFTPKITKVDTASGSAYLSVFTQEKTPLEKLMQGEKLFVAQNPLSADQAVSGAAGTVLTAAVDNVRLAGTDGPLVTSQNADQWFHGILRNVGRKLTLALQQTGSLGYAADVSGDGKIVRVTLDNQGSLRQEPASKGGMSLMLRTTKEAGEAWVSRQAQRPFIQFFTDHGIQLPGAVVRWFIRAIYAPIVETQYIERITSPFHTGPRLTVSEFVGMHGARPNLPAWAIHLRDLFLSPWHAIRTAPFFAVRGSPFIEAPLSLSLNFSGYEKRSVGNTAPLEEMELAAGLAQQTWKEWVLRTAGTWLIVASYWAGFFAGAAAGFLLVGGGSYLLLDAATNNMAQVMALIGGLLGAVPGTILGARLGQGVFHGAFNTVSPVPLMWGKSDLDTMLESFAFYNKLRDSREKEDRQQADEIKSAVKTIVDRYPKRLTIKSVMNKTMGAFIQGIVDKKGNSTDVLKSIQAADKFLIAVLGPHKDKEGRNDFMAEAAIESLSVPLAKAYGHSTEEALSLLTAVHKDNRHRNLVKFANLLIKLAGKSEGYPGVALERLESVMRATAAVSKSPGLQNDLDFLSDELEKVLDLVPYNHISALESVENIIQKNPTRGILALPEIIVPFLEKSQGRESHKGAVMGVLNDFINTYPSSSQTNFARQIVQKVAERPDLVMEAVDELIGGSGGRTTGFASFRGITNMERFVMPLVEACHDGEPAAEAIRCLAEILAIAGQKPTDTSLSPGIEQVLLASVLPALKTLAKEAGDAAERQVPLIVAALARNQTVDIEAAGRRIVAGARADVFEDLSKVLPLASDLLDHPMTSDRLGQLGMYFNYMVLPIVTRRAGEAPPASVLKSLFQNAGNINAQGVNFAELYNAFFSGSTSWWGQQAVGDLAAAYWQSQSDMDRTYQNFTTLVALRIAPTIGLLLRLQKTKDVSEAAMMTTKWAGLLQSFREDSDNFNFQNDLHVDLGYTLYRNLPEVAREPALRPFQVYLRAVQGARILDYTLKDARRVEASKIGIGLLGPGPRAADRGGALAADKAGRAGILLGVALILMSSFAQAFWQLNLNSLIQAGLGFLALGSGVAGFYRWQISDLDQSAPGLDTWARTDALTGHVSKLSNTDEPAQLAYKHVSPFSQAAVDAHEAWHWLFVKLGAGWIRSKLGKAHPVVIALNVIDETVAHTMAPVAAAPVLAGKSMKVWSEGAVSWRRLAAVIALGAILSACSVTGAQSIATATPKPWPTLAPAPSPTASPTPVLTKAQLPKSLVTFQEKLVGNQTLTAEEIHRAVIDYFGLNLTFDQLNELPKLLDARVIDFLRTIGSLGQGADPAKLSGDRVQGKMLVLFLAEDAGKQKPFLLPDIQKALMTSLTGKLGRDFVANTMAESGKGDALAKLNGSPTATPVPATPAAAVSPTAPAPTPAPPAQAAPAKPANNTPAQKPAAPLPTTTEAMHGALYGIAGAEEISSPRWQAIADKYVGSSEALEMFSATVLHTVQPSSARNAVQRELLKKFIAKQGYAKVKTALRKGMSYFLVRSFEQSPHIPHFNLDGINPDTLKSIDDYVSQVGGPLETHWEVMASEVREGMSFMSENLIPVVAGDPQLTKLMEETLMSQDFAVEFQQLLDKNHYVGLAEEIKARLPKEKLKLPKGSADEAYVTSNLNALIKSAETKRTGAVSGFNNVITKIRNNLKKSAAAAPSHTGGAWREGPVYLAIAAYETVLSLGLGQGADFLLHGVSPVLAVAVASLVSVLVFYIPHFLRKDDAWKSPDVLFMTALTALFAPAFFSMGGYTDSQALLAVLAPLTLGHEALNLVRLGEILKKPTATPDDEDVWKKNQAEEFALKFWSAVKAQRDARLNPQDTDLTAQAIKALQAPVVDGAIRGFLALPNGMDPYAAFLGSVDQKLFEQASPMAFRHVFGNERLGKDELIREIFGTLSASQRMPLARALAQSTQDQRVTLRVVVPAEGSEEFVAGLLPRLNTFHAASAVSLDVEIITDHELNLGKSAGGLNVSQAILPGLYKDAPGAKGQLDPMRLNDFFSGANSGAHGTLILPRISLGDWLETIKSLPDDAPVRQMLSIVLNEAFQVVSLSRLDDIANHFHLAQLIASQA